MADNLSQLLATPLQPLREQWRSAAQAELLRTAPGPARPQSRRLLGLGRGAAALDAAMGHRPVRRAR